MTTNQGQMRETYPASGEAYRFRLEETDGRLVFILEGEGGEGPQQATCLTLESHGTGEGLCRDESGETHAFAWAWVGPDLHLWLDGELYVFQRVEGRRRGNASGSGGSAEVLAPMPGAVLEVLVGEGERVERNQTVVIMESMKMEMVITAPRSGVVGRVTVQPGQQVERGMRLLELSPESGSGE